ncbi:MAG: tRNA uridine-5-carboxymethylaminomethyl(34) synthesis GTPase MnmE, partial [Candidatus Omnitrophota bacterium]
MYGQNPSDAIVAISTPVGESGIGIVRISGRNSLLVADKIFVSKDGKSPSDFLTFTTHYGWIVSSHKSQVTSHKSNSNNLQPTACSQRQDIIDEVLLTVMRAPKSYTKEDIVEINCHGGIVALRRVLDLVLENGCRLAEPGEFTKRAFLNGRIDLAQAEAVLDIIKAKADSGLRMGLEQLKGVLSHKIRNLRNDLLDILMKIEANIDFSEEEILPVDANELAQKLDNIDREFRGILSSSKYARILREGISAVICGRPNVGKSSLLNALLKQERSIVTPVAGTTRDTIEEIINIKGIPLRIMDTAGIIEPRDMVEKKAIQRTKRYIEMADLVILLFDGSEKLTKADADLIGKSRQKTVLAVINKIDLKQKINRARISEKFRCLIDVSAKKLKNIDVLEEAIASLVYNGRVNMSESILVSNLRHIELMKKAHKLIREAIDSLDNKLSLEFTAQDIKDALGYLDRLLGRQ